MSSSRFQITPSAQSEPNREAEGEGERLVAIERQWAPGFVTALLRDLSAIWDQRMRALALGERLANLSNDAVIAVAWRVHDEVMKGDERAIELVGCFRDSEALEQRLGADRMEAIAALAKSEGHEVAAVLVAPVQRSSAGRVRTHNDLRELTLGQRKSLARTTDRDMLMKLLEDEHPHVQDMLLQNPRVTVREVVGVAARRPAQQHVLRGIARHPRWMHNYEVRRALAKNPDTPLDVAGRMIVALQRADVAEIADDDRLDATLRSLAKKRLQFLGDGDTGIVYVIDDDDADDALE